METTIKTKEQLLSAPNEDLQALYEDARNGKRTAGGVKNKETNTIWYDPEKSFQGYYGTEYSFSKLKTEMERRGLIEASSKDDDEDEEKRTYNINPFNPSVRCDLMCDREVLAAFKKRFPNSKEKRIHLTAALLLYMEMVDANEVNINLTIL